MAAVKQFLQNDARRSAFLDNASQSLLATSPAVSAFLGSLHLRTSRAEAGKVQRCLGCGTILLPSRTCKRINTAHGRHAKGRKSVDTPIRYRCTSCGALSALDKPQRRRKPPARLPTGPLDPKVTTKSPAIDSVKSFETTLQAHEGRDKATSRKRARPRKTGGLGALLAQSKSQQPKSAGLDLMDFMSAG